MVLPLLPSATAGAGACTLLSKACSLQPTIPRFPSTRCSAHTTSQAEFEETLRINLLSSFGVLRAAAKAMMRPANGGGSIVFCSSAVAKHGIPNHEAIAAAKVRCGGLGRW